jgi:hypothetical protein
MQSYYHVIEDAGYGRIGSHGYYETAEEAQKEADRLAEFFPRLNFYVHSSPSKREPEFVTI